MNTTVHFTCPRQRWLYGGTGFHNSEATMYKLMPERYRDEAVLKCFAEVSPTYSRVFAGYADWTKEAMDAFADYYDLTFRRAGTLLYLVPGRMPMPDEDFDPAAYAEKVAEKLDYLVNGRGCRRIRYYCVTNELSAGNTYCYLGKHLDLLKILHEALYKAFRKHGLDIGLMATDASGLDKLDQIPWAIANMDEVTEVYCAHLYTNDIIPGDPKLYPLFAESFAVPVGQAWKKEKRFCLGEYGINMRDKWNSTHIMRDDVSYAVDVPEDAGNYALAAAECSLAAMNVGCLFTTFWTMFDYPDPFLRENGDSKEERERYDVSRFSGHGLDIRYNKNGLISWADECGRWEARAAYYTMGRLAKLFRKGSRVFPFEIEGDDAADAPYRSDTELRCGAVSNPDGSFTCALISWAKEERAVTVRADWTLDKPLRKYTFRAECPPANAFGDLPAHDALVSAENGVFTLTLPPRSMVFLTTDYTDRKPSEVTGLRLDGDTLVWDASPDAAHRYWRVYRNGMQIASTVSERYTPKRKPEEGDEFAVYSVDRDGNCLKND